MNRFRHIKWVLAAISAIFFILIALSLKNMQPFDSFVYRQIARLHSPFAVHFFHACSALASPAVLLTSCLVMAFCLRRTNYQIPLLLNLALSVFLNLALKSLFVRPRPQDVLVLAVETGYSFPSGHTMSAACFYGFLIFLLVKLVSGKPLRLVLSGLLSAIIVLVCASRIYLGVHYASDVLGGLLISVVYLVAYTSFVEKYIHHPETAVLKPSGDTGGAFLKSFSYAAEGILSGLRQERNMVVHFGVMAVVSVFGAALQLSKSEWIICILLFGLVLMAELFNTALESVVDMVMPQWDARAKVAKDTSAGAVLVLSIAAALIGCIIFAPKILALLSEFLPS